jgi:LysM repeat protein
MKYLGCIVFFMCVGLIISPTKADSLARMDSVGRVTENGKIFILHKVTKGQTMYAVMRQYKTSIRAILDANPGINDQLRLDQVIKVPFTGVTTAKASPSKEERKKKEEKKVVPAESVTVSTAPSGADLHMVEAGQTLYSVAVKYAVLMADIRKWNKMTSDNVKIGEELIVSEKLYLERNTNGDSEPIRDTIRSMPKTTASASTTIPSKNAAGKRFRETGLAEMIETAESSSKYLALHRSASVGTLVQVKNEFNQEMIWVKVIGRIPNTSVNDDIVIKLSARAFEKLSPTARRFRAEISYISTN